MHSPPRGINATQSTQTATRGCSGLRAGITLNPTVAAQPSVTTESEDSAAARANAEQEAIDNAAEAAATPAPGREDLEPAEPGFDDNTIDNDAGADWHATTDPEATITPRADALRQ